MIRKLSREFYLKMSVLFLICSFVIALVVHGFSELRFRNQEMRLGYFIKELERDANNTSTNTAKIYYLSSILNAYGNINDLDGKEVKAMTITLMKKGVITPSDLKEDFE